MFMPNSSSWAGGTNREKASKIQFCDEVLQLPSLVYPMNSVQAFGLENPLDSMESLSIRSACNAEHVGGQGAASGLCKPAGGRCLFISRGMRNLLECLTPIN